MKKNIVLASPLIVAVLFLAASVTEAQLKQIPVTQQKSAIPSVSFFVAGSYFAPDYSKINEMYRSIEKSVALPEGDDFKSHYLVVAGIRITPGAGQSLQGEFGGTVSRTAQEKTNNYLRTFYAGGSYIMSFPLPMVSVYGGGGLGYVWLNSERTYNGYPGSARVNAQLTELHGMVGIEFFDQSGISFSLEGKYTYSTTLAPERADLDFTMKGAVVGARLGVPIAL